MSEKFNVSVSITENNSGNSGGGGSGSSGSGAKGVGVGMFIFLVLVLAIFGGIGNTVFSHNAFVYAPSTLTYTSSAIPMAALCIAPLAMLFVALIPIIMWSATRRGRHDE